MVRGNLPFTLNARLLLTEDVSATPLSIISWKALANGMTIVPDMWSPYAARNVLVSGGTVYKYFPDAPLITLDTPPYYYDETSDWGEDKVGSSSRRENSVGRYQEIYNDFDFVVEGDTVQITPISYGYECRLQSNNPTLLSTSVHKFIYSFANSDYIRTVPQIDYEASLYTQDADIFPCRLDVRLGGLEDFSVLSGSNFNTSGGIVIDYRARTNIQLSAQFCVGVRYPSTIVYNAGASDVVTINLHGAFRLEEWERKSSTSSDWNLKLSSDDSETFLNTLPFVTGFGKAPSAAWQIKSKTKSKIVFTAEYRPWIFIYDVVKFSYFDDYGNKVTKFGTVYAVDANVDTLTAEYTVMIFED